eukprot:CAMPEP_0172640008 /NCGR_PEP_ID=MMETSP1068-20121228/221025_1 /TAXON_ID=35684 /ORGANISM="Pseudopedinella elastica, Strain CCMP716" /LENGTH=153 /DNA_ID=CAMNT_0013453285 /DNA_START=27 /DNA_END=488 /DNA_ORIENTATION=-
MDSRHHRRASPQHTTKFDDSTGISIKHTIQVPGKCLVALSLLCVLGCGDALACGRRNFFAAHVGAAASLAAPSASQAKVWLSGKSETPKKDKEDRSGTRKDPKFLRCLSNCVSDCQRIGSGSNKDRDTCLLECQDGCCFTYEQCSATLNPNLV